MALTPYSLPYTAGLPALFPRFAAGLDRAGPPTLTCLASSSDPRRYPRMTAAHSRADRFALFWELDMFASGFPACHCNVEALILWEAQL